MGQSGFTGSAASNLRANESTPWGISGWAYVDFSNSSQHAPDLAGVGADLVELGVAQQAAGRIVVDVAVAAELLINRA
jgi:hypothetical protein